MIGEIRPETSDNFESGQMVMKEMESSVIINEPALKVDEPIQNEKSEEILMNGYDFEAQVAFEEKNQNEIIIHNESNQMIPEENKEEFLPITVENQQ